MGVISTQGFAFRLIANNDTQLDLFDDEEIFISDNVTGLFDLGTLPADFTRQITVPGTKKNNAFFEHVYDISIQSPYLFATNAKVPCYFDFGSFYLADGYMQLNKVNVIANKFIDSYEISIYGGLSSFARDINRYFLTDLTASLSQFNHTASFNNISSSWNGELFSGSIVYPFAEYGQKIQFTPEEAFFGIDSNEGALCVQDFKPSIRIKEVWDAIFETYGYTYSGSFWQQPWLDNVYMICNNQLRYPVFDNIDLETYGLFRIAPISGSGQTNVTMSAAVELQFPWYNVQSNPQNNIGNNLVYTLDVTSRLRGELALNFEVKSTGTGNGMPAFYLHVRDAVTNALVSTTALVNYNRYMTQIQTYNSPQTRTQQFQLVTEFNTAQLPIGTYKFYLEYVNTVATNFQVILNPGNTLSNTYLEIKKVNQGGDNLVMDIAANMPFGTTGIKQVDFITGLQKKFNLVIYPNKVKPREFIVEEFNSWYTQGQIKDFNRYINLDKKIEFIPANNLAVNKLNFGDTLDGDYVSQQFSKANNREYGKSYYVDTENFFSQGTFEVKTTFASSPLIYLEGTGLSGSVGTNEAGFRARSEATATTRVVGTTSSIRHFTTTVVSTNTTALAGEGTTFDCDPASCIGTTPYIVNAGDVLVFSSGGTDSVAWQFSKTTDAGTTVLDSGTAPGGATYNYIITAADISSTYLEFIAEAQGTE
jgi:hypothetical protein